MLTFLEVTVSPVLKIWASANFLPYTSNLLMTLGCTTEYRNEMYNLHAASVSAAA